jgi:hypothetical protein
MELPDLPAAALAWTALALVVLCLVLAPSYLRRRISRPLKAELKELPALLLDLKLARADAARERARAAGTIATAKRRGALADDDEDDDEEPRGGGIGEALGDLGELLENPVAAGILQGLGIDAARLAAQDPGEVQKALLLCHKMKVNPVRLLRGDPAEIERALDAVQRALPVGAAQPQPAQPAAPPPPPPSKPDTVGYL